MKMEKIDFSNLTQEDKIDLGQCFDIISKDYIKNLNSNLLTEFEEKDIQQFKKEVISLWIVKQRIKSTLSRFKTSEKQFEDFLDTGIKVPSS